VFSGVPTSPGPVILDYDDVARLDREGLLGKLCVVNLTGRLPFVAVWIGITRWALGGYLIGQLGKAIGVRDGNKLNLRRGNITTRHRAKAAMDAARRRMWARR